MNFESLSNNDLEKLVVSLSTKERKATVELLYHLKEFDNRRAFLEIGYSSMYDYCIRKLGYSDGGAYRRIAAARALGSNPEIAELIVTGKVTLSSIATASKSLKSSKTTIEEIAGKSQREVEKLVSIHNPVSKPKEVVKPLSVIEPIMAMSLPLEVPLTPQEERYHLKFSVTKEIYNRLNEAKERLSNTLSELSLESLLEKLLDNYLSKPERKPTSNKGNTRYIPPVVKDTVFKRDGGQCTYVASDGTRCCQRCYLHLDHIDPYSLGGKSPVENLRLLCSAHNHHEAREAFG